MAAPRIHAVLTAATDPGARSALRRLAQRMAAQIQGAVGLISVGGGTADELRVERIEAHQPPRFIPGSFHSPQSPPDVQLARVLFSLRNVVECWLIMVPPLASPTSTDPDAIDEVRRCLLASAPERILLMTPRREDILGAYGLLKDLSSQEAIETPQIKVVLDGPEHSVHAAFKRLALTAHNLLKLELTRLELPRATPDMLEGTAGVESVAKFDLAVLSAAGRQAIWLSVTDMVEELTGAASLDESEEEPENESGTAADTLNPQSFDDLMDVLEPAERAALAADWPEHTTPGSPETDATKVENADGGHAQWGGGGGAGHVSQSDAPKNITSANLSDVTPVVTPNPPSPAPSISTPISVPAPTAMEPPVSVAQAPAPITAPSVTMPRVVDCPILPTHAASLWPLVRESLNGLLGGHSILTAQPPAPHSLLSTDASGRLHLWVLADPADPVAWSTLWQWARQNQQLIALTQRLDPAAHAPCSVVDVHVILPPAAAAGATQPGLVIRGNAAAESSTADGGTIHYYRTLPVTWNARTGLLVIPA
ncbi:MAG: hypothetical protein WCI73_00675 [Phycisphaerae bacterium]